jgi:hypothetical protein
LLIGVDADNQDVAEFSCAGEIANVSDVKHVETSVSQHDSRAVFSGSRHSLHQFFST